ncbi:lysozyme-like protein, partial [Linderina pennispora]
MKFTATLGFVAAVAAFGSANAAMSACSKKIALQLTNIYENGDTAFHYDYCENIKDGRGYTAGIAGFCTWHFGCLGCPAGLPQDDWRQGRVQQRPGGLLLVWGKLGKSDAKFRKAQDNVRDSMYFNPSQKLADKLGATLDVTRAQLYDTTIQHGEGTDPDSVGALIKKTSA